MGKPKYPGTQIVIPPELKQLATKIGKEQSKNFSEVVIDALNLWLDKQ